MCNKVTIPADVYKCSHCGGNTFAVEATDDVPRVWKSVEWDDSAGMLIVSDNEMCWDGCTETKFEFACAACGLIDPGLPDELADLVEFA